MRPLSACLLLVHLAAGTAHAQKFEDLQIRLGFYSSSENGGEKPSNMWRNTGPVVVGETTISTFSSGPACDARSVSARKGDAYENATAAWYLEMTPIRVVDSAVTFRLNWVRSGALRGAKDDLELTLRPGESWPVDSVPIPPEAKSRSGRPCATAVSIRASVDHYPEPEYDTRLVATDLWLVERLANGSETQRSQALSVRSVPNDRLWFYFDRVTEANVPLDIFGTLIVRPEAGAVAVSLETRSQWPHAPNSNVVGPQQYVRSRVQAKPGEIVEIRLPRFDTSAGPFANRELAIRIRAGQIR